MNTVLKASTPADLVASLPYLFGFPPSDSIIALAFRGKRLIASGRVDADAIDDPDQLRDRMEAVAQHGDLIIIVAWVDPVAAAERAASLASAALGGVDQIIIVSGGRCRTDQGPWVDCPTSNAVAEAAGLEVLSDRAAVGAKVAGPGTDKLTGRRWSKARSTVALQSHWWCEDRFDSLLARGLEAPDSLSVAERVDLAALAYSGLIRERVWDHFTADRANQHMALWRAVVAVVAPEGATAPLGLLAFAAWLVGEGALATCCVERGLGIAPDHSLLLLFNSINLAGLPPSAWSEMRQTLMAQRDRSPQLAANMD